MIEACGGEGGAGDFTLRPHILFGLLRNHALRAQGFCASEIAFGLRHLLLRLRALGVQVGHDQRGKHLPSRDVLASFDAHLGNDAGRLE